MFLKTSPLTPPSDYAFSVKNPSSDEARGSDVIGRVEKKQEAVDDAAASWSDIVVKDANQSIDTAQAARSESDSLATSAKSSVLPARHTLVQALARDIARESAEGDWGGKALRGTLTESPPESTSHAPMNYVEYERIPATSAAFRNCSKLEASVVDVGAVIPLDQPLASSGGHRSRGSAVMMPLPASPWGPFCSGTHADDDGNGVSCGRTSAANVLQPR